MPATACPSRRFPGMDRAIPGPLRAKGPRPLGTRMTGMTGMTARRIHVFGRHLVPPDRPCGRCVPAGMRGRPRRVPRRSRCGSLATLPGVAFRTPPLTSTSVGERLHSMAPRGRHHSAVVTGRGLSPRVAVRTGDAPQGRVPLRAAQPGLTSTQPRRAGPTCGCRSMQDVYSCVRAVLWPTRTHEYLALRGRPRACGTPVASRSRETRRGALAPLRDVRAVWHARATFHFPGRRPSPAPLCGRRPCRF